MPSVGSGGASRRRRGRRTIAALVAAVGVLSGAAGAPGDSRYAADTPYGIPASLHRSLDERLAMFITAQAEGRWEEVAALLGRFRKGGRGFEYTPDHKECLLEQMQSGPMVWFEPRSIAYSSELMSIPPETWWWHLQGDAEFRKAAGIERVSTTVFAYRDQGQWYFTPPDYDDEWERSHITAAERTADHGSEIQVDLHPECPLALRDVRVAMDERWPSLRILTYALVNKAAMKVKGYGLGLARAGEPCFGVSAGVPTAIDPRAVSRREKSLSYSAYGYWCDGVANHRLVIDSVDFENGWEWHDPRFQTSEFRETCR